MIVIVHLSQEVVDVLAIGSGFSFRFLFLERRWLEEGLCVPRGGCGAASVKLQGNFHSGFNDNV